MDAFASLPGGSLLTLYYYKKMQKAMKIYHLALLLQYLQDKPKLTSQKKLLKIIGLMQNYRCFVL